MLLKLRTNRILEIYLHGKAANAKQVDLTIMDVDDNEEWAKRKREKEEEAIRLRGVDKKAEEDRILQNQQRQQIQKKRREREKKELEEEERAKKEKRETEELKLREQAILMLSEEVEEAELEEELEEEDWVDFDEDIHVAAGNYCKAVLRCAVLYCVVLSSAEQCSAV